MTLLSPWWLLLLPLGYLVILLHTLHPERTRVIVPSVLLWQRVVKKLAADARWRRIVSNLLLILQLLALGAIMLALSQPAFLHSATLRHDIVLCDVSASMSATDLPTHRLQAVKEKLLAELMASRPRRLTIIAVGANPAVVYNGSASRQQIIKALDKVAPTHESANWAKAAALAQAESSRQVRLLVATDGAFATEELQELTQLVSAASIEVVQAAGSAENVGIVAFDARQIGASMAECEVLVAVANFTSSTTQIPVVVESLKGELQRQVLTVPAQEKRHLVFKHTFATQDILTAHIEWSDALPVDNTAYLVAYPPEPTRVLLVGPGNYYLEQGLRVFPQVRLEKKLLYPGQTDHPLVIFDRMPVPDDFQGTGLYLAGTAAERINTTTAPEVTRWDRTHILTRFLDWSDLQIAQQFQLPSAVGERVLVDASGGPLLQLIETDQYRLLQLGFRLDESDLPYKVAFPVFLSHLLQWAHPSGWAYIRSTLQPGSNAVLPQAFLAEGAWQVHTPAGAVVSVPASAPGFSATSMAGLYTVTSGDNTYTFAVNAGNDAESNIKPRLTSLPDVTPVSAQKSLPAPFWPVLAFCALFFLLCEEWLYLNKARRPWPRKGA